MDDENLKASFLMMDNCTIHQSKLMIRKIENRGYRVMYLPPYSPELNPIEQFWAFVKGRLKHHRLLTEEKCLKVLLRLVMIYLLKICTILLVNLNNKLFIIIIKSHPKYSNCLKINNFWQSDNICRYRCKSSRNALCGMSNTLFGCQGYIAFWWALFCF